MFARLVSALIGVCGLCACSEAESPACTTTRVRADVCETPGNLRGAEPVQVTWTTDPVPQLEPLPLAEGRYVQIARTLHCAESYDPPPELAVAPRNVLELNGCVMRSTLELSTEEPTVEVLTFSYAADGTLDLTRKCPDAGSVINGKAYGFDGTTALFPNTEPVQGPDGRAYDCETVDALELR